MLNHEIPAMVTAFFLYLVATIFYIGHLVFLKPGLARIGKWAALAGLAANVGAAILRTIASGRTPFANMYEFGVVLVAVVVGTYLWIDFRKAQSVLGAFAMPVAFIFSGVFLLFFQEAKPLMPALKSNWLLAHVVTAVIAYGALTFSFAVALTHRWRSYLEAKDNNPALLSLVPEPILLENMMHQSILFAMPFLTLLILTGAVWAEYAWGTYWRWDPKETWSLITWLVYAVYLHGRAVYAWRGRTAVNWAIAGFAIMVFTFVGVNILLPGLHSYAL